ncbi:MAG: TonB-dependent receptor [Acidobacteria bacterium]|nr:TonB-dependent receptor [Acidobacteriota bacterium]
MTVKGTQGRVPGLRATTGPRAFAVLAAALCLLLAPATAGAQSTAINGSIEGTIVDASALVLPGVTVTVTNTDDGSQRVVVSNERGVYRAPLLPLGSYKIVAELSGFKRFERVGVTLSAGQTAVVNISLTVGEMTETISVTAEAPLVDMGKIDIGRNLGEREVKNLPLVSRNPYNFALLQTGVTGYENTEFGVPRFSANGTLLRINYQIDGNTNTQKDRAGLRMMPMSEVMIKEVKVITSGYAPEFGQTTGMVYNAITPSGTNTVKGSGSYRLRRKPFSAFPFFFQGPQTEERRPDTKINTYTAEVGGPIIKDKLHFFGGYENTFRDLSQQRIINIDPAVAAAVGLPPQPAYVPFTQTAGFIIGKLDYQLGKSNRVSFRVLRFTNDQPGNAAGNLTAIESTNDYLDTMNSIAAQLVSTIGNSTVNEFRTQYANRHTEYLLSKYSGTGQPVTITGQVSFGRPWDSPQDFKQGILQFIDNLTWMKGSHAFKTGADFQVVFDGRVATISSRFTFPTVAAYLSAKSGATPYSYTTFSQTIGNPNFEMTSKLFSAFVQDDWKISPDLKMLYGVRYDLYLYPPADASAPFAYSQKFNIDKNNFGPRVGVAWNIGKNNKTVLRASTGIMYDQAMLGGYNSAIETNGNSNRVSISLSPAAAGAPAFPNTLSNLPPGYVMPAQNIFTIDPKFQTGYTFQNNVQLERSLANNFSVSTGLVFVKGYHLPVVNNINVINPIGTLADGRPIFSGQINANTRMDPRFNQINSAESIGESTYKAVTIQFARRSATLQFDVNYSLGKGVDNAPASGTLSFLGDGARSDPTNLERDRGPNLLDIRHNFAGSVVATPAVSTGHAFWDVLLNNNQMALMLQFNSGLPFTITSNRDLNGDGSGSDRPLYVGRNSMYYPNRWNVDARFSRYVPIHKTYRAEVIFEFKNLFNIVQTQSVTTTTQVDLLGNPLAPIPTYVSSYSNPGGFVPNGGFEQREFQVGFKLYF